MKSETLTLLAMAASAGVETAGNKPGAFTKGSAEYLAEREARLAAQVAKAKAALDKVAADKAADTFVIDNKISELTELRVGHEATLRVHRTSLSRIDDGIATRRAEIARIERDIAALSADKKRVEEMVIPAEEAAQRDVDAALEGERAKRTGLDKKWHRQLNDAEKEHRNIDLRLTRLRLRK